MAAAPHHGDPGRRKSVSVKEGRAFIAAQGPLAGTVDDFWRMVCHHRVETILALTECDRGGAG